MSGFLVLGVAANTGTNANCQLEVGNYHLNFSSNYRRKEEVARCWLLTFITLIAQPQYNSWYTRDDDG